MKFLLALFSFLLFSLLSFRSFSVGGPALAADLDCAALDVIDVIPDADTCQAIKNMFTNNQTPGPWYNQNPNQFAEKVFSDNPDEIFGERYTFAQINWIINSIAAMLNPASGISNPKQLFDFFIAIKKAIVQTQSGQPLAFSDYAKLGPAGLFAGGISALYTNPPASGIQEIKYTASKFFDYTTGAEPAYAQGYGFSGLNSGGAVRALWTASRNMAYLIMTILLIASGFLIMFRVKINPQTVVSLQTMIPKLIITMILVTFSFAIAGLVIDLIYVFIAAFIGLLQFSGNIITQPLFGAYPIKNPTFLINFLTTSSFWNYVSAQLMTSILFLLVLLAVGGLMATSPAAPIGIGLIIIVIGIAIYLVVVLLKIFWMLLQSYVILILQICIAPLQIMLDLIPGQQGFGPWIRSIIANASVFVTVPILLILQKVLSWDPLFSWIYGVNNFGGLGGNTLGLPFLGKDVNAAWNLLTQTGVGIAIFAITPKIADIVRDALKVPAFKYGAALTEPISQPAGLAMTVSKLAQDLKIDRSTFKIPGFPSGGSAVPAPGALKPAPGTTIKTP